MMIQHASQPVILLSHSLAQEEGMFGSDFDAASLLDLTLFLACVKRFRRERKMHVMKARIHTLWKDLRDSIISLLSASLQKSVRDLIQSVGPDISNRSIPSRKKRKRESELELAPDSIVPWDGANDDVQPTAPGRAREHKSVRVDPNQVWEWYQDSVNIAGVSFPQLVRTKERSKDGGCTSGACRHWLAKLQSMYLKRASMGLQGENHYNLISDAARHSCRETLVSAIFSRHNNIGVYCTSQVLKSSKMAHPGEIECSLTVERLLATRKQERMAAYRFLQGLSHQLSLVTNGAVGMSSFLCDNPALGHLDNVLHIVKGHMVFLVDKVTKRTTATVNLLDLVNHNILIAGMDQGPSNMAACGFLHQQAMTQFYFDPFHRCNRDLKLAANSVAPKAVRTRLSMAHLCSTYLWTLSYKPFRQGAFFQEKTELLEMFLNSEGEDSELLERFADLVALDMGVESVDLSLLAELKTFRNKSSCVKSGRWFSWSNSAHDHFGEFWASRMLLTALFPDECPDTRTTSTTFAELRKEAGGLKLALKCCSWNTWFSVRAMKLANDVLWTWYSKTVKKIKTPHHGLERLAQMADGQWMSDAQFTGLINLFSDWGDFETVLQYDKCSLRHLEQSKLQNYLDDLWFYVLGCLNKRASSMCMHNSPPEVYAAAVVLDDPVRTVAAVQLMKNDWDILRRLEHSKSQSTSEILDDVRYTVSKPMRLVYQLYQADLTEKGRDILASLVTRLPDTKFVEDIHQTIRGKAQSQPHEKLNHRQIQSLVETSQTFESRGILHPAALDKKAMLSRWASTKPSDSKQQFLAASEKLPKVFADIVGSKKWPSMSEECLSRSSACWAWLRHYVSEKMNGQNIKLKDACHD